MIYNQQSWDHIRHHILAQVFEEIDRVHSVPSSEILRAEFEIYAELSFALHIPIRELRPHFSRLLKVLESNPRKYLGLSRYEEYSHLILDEEARLLEFFDYSPHRHHHLSTSHSISSVIGNERSSA